MRRRNDQQENLRQSLAQNSESCFLNDLIKVRRIKSKRTKIGSVDGSDLLTSDRRHRHHRRRHLDEEDELRVREPR
jgi:hypothetical protein